MKTTNRLFLPAAAVAFFLSVLCAAGLYAAEYTYGSWTWYHTKDVHGIVAKLNQLDPDRLSDIRIHISSSNTDSPDYHMWVKKGTSNYTWALRQAPYPQGHVSIFQNLHRCVTIGFRKSELVYAACRI